VESDPVEVMSINAEEQADEAASLSAIFGDDVEYDSSLNTYKVRQATLQCAATSIAAAAAAAAAAV
jgi:hypothetical protein